MKKGCICFFIIILSFLITNYVYARDILQLDEPIIQFEQIDKYGLQGYCVVRDKLFLVLEGYDDTKSIIKVFNLNTYREEINYEYGSLGHANDVTYNNKTNKIYVLASSGSNIVYVFNGDTFKHEDTIKVELPIRSITYLDKYDKYAVRTIASGFIFNEDFTLKSKLPFIIGMNFSTELGRQGWSYYNDYIYYANWSWVRMGGDGTNIVYIYDLNGNNIDSIYTSNDIGEIEGVDFYNNQMLLGFNGYDNKVKFYVSDIPEVKVHVYEEGLKEEDTIEKDNEPIIYCFLVIGIIIIFFIAIIFVKYKKKLRS